MQKLDKSKIKTKKKVPEKMVIESGIIRTEITFNNCKCVGDAVKSFDYAQ